MSDPPAGTEWLIDKSALTRLGASADAAAWAERIHRGTVRVATVTLLEVGYSARDAADLDAGLRGPQSARCRSSTSRRLLRIGPSTY